MKQIVQNLKSGKTILEEVPVPKVSKNYVLIKTSKSLVSLGTEKMLIEFSKANYFQKIKKQPEKFKLVLNKIKTDGIKSTINAVFNKLNTPLPLGYCNVGIVEEVGENVIDIKVGDRVVSNGGHAEYVLVSKNLLSKVPKDVSDDEAVFTVIGSIGLQGIRLLKPTFGETFVVIGLGLIGLISSELLISNGCNVIAFDYDSKKVDLAKKKGINALNLSKEIDLNQINYVIKNTNGVGADGVLICASSKKNDIISNSARMCRKRGRIILIGVIGLDINREDFYNKEISFQVSCSYGPGRYDDNYENKGIDYPIGYVRWTEKRNFEAILNAISNKTLNVSPLITEKLKFEEFDKIYSKISSSNSIASIFEYNPLKRIIRNIKINEKIFDKKKSIIGLIGSGNFTSSIILPNLKKLNANIKYLCSSKGLSSTTLAKKYNIANSTSDYNMILNDSDIDLVFITTRHDSHAELVIKAIKSNKNIFVEKPLAISSKQLNDIINAYQKSKSKVLVGYNRRFSNFSKIIKNLIGNTNSPINIIANMNAGRLPIDSWINDLDIGGGRIVGEACHLIDLCNYFTNDIVSEVCMNSLENHSKKNTENASILLKYNNGSNAVINYFSNGSKLYSKERIELYFDDKTIILDNWKKLNAYGFNSLSSKSSSQDKGHYNQFKELISNQVNGDDPLISFEDLINSSKVSFAAIKSLQNKKWIEII